MGLHRPTFSRLQPTLADWVLPLMLHQAYGPGYSHSNAAVKKSRRPKLPDFSASFMAGPLPSA